MEKAKLQELRQTYSLPKYTKGEEIFNMVSHIAGAALGVTVLTLLIIFSALKGNSTAVITSIIYGFSMIMVYTVSSVYHGLAPSRAKKILRIIDHCDIYLLIAGTYTPILMVAVWPVNPAAALTILIIEWVTAVLAITLTAINMEKYKIFSMLCYLVLGWCIVFIFSSVIEALTYPGVILLLAGGIAYTLGSILYGIGRKVKYMHSIFHLFCIGGSLLQFLALIFYCI